MKSERVYFYRGGVERGGAVNGKPSYRWFDGYSANADDGSMLYPWQTIRECQSEAKRDDVRAVFKNAKHGLPLEAEAIKANGGPYEVED